MESKRQSKSGKKSDTPISRKDSANEQVHQDNDDLPKERTKSRLRRRRNHDGGGQQSPESGDESDVGRKITTRRRKKRKKRKSSKATTATTEESSEWTSRSRLAKSGISTPEVRKRESKPKELSEKDLVEWMQKCIPYVTFNSPLWNKWTLAPLHNFLRHANTTLCVAFLLEENVPTKGVLRRMTKVTQGNFIVFNSLVPEYSGEFFYFLKVQPVAIDGLNFEEIVIFGNVPQGDQVKALSGLLSYYWTPILLDKECLPQGIKNDVFTDMNTVSCVSQTTTHFLTEESRFELFLYVPSEIFWHDGESGDTLRNEYEMASDKQLCSRLEETAVFWITRLEQVLAVQELSDLDMMTGPLEEIQFWKDRTKNLCNILLQLKSQSIHRMLKILAIAHSPYVSELQKIFVEIDKKHREASSNAHYLQPLGQPLETIPKAKLKDIRVEIQKFVWLTLTVWRNAPFYRTSDLLNGLLRKFSNALVILCKNRINVAQIFEGVRLDKKEGNLRNCLKCMGWWREIYKLTETMHKKNAAEVWVFDEDQIFVNVDAMVLRLEHLLEICQAQNLYRLKSLPLYPGIKGPFITGVMKRCETLLLEKLEEMKSMAEVALDVRSTEWHAHMKGFRDTVLAIDMSVQNVLEESFEQMPSLKRRVELVQLFHRFYGKREVITRQLDKLCVKLYENMEHEVLLLRKLFERKVVPLPGTFPELAGKATWAEMMRRRIESELDILKKADPWLPKASGVGFQNLVKSEAKGLAEAMGAYAGKCYTEWAKQFSEVHGAFGESYVEDHRGRLEIPLLIRSKGDLVKINFDRVVYKSLSEAEAWVRLGRSVPAVLLMTLYSWKEKLHILREVVSMVARWYNKCVFGLSRDELLLFKEKLLPVEKKIYPCLAQGQWTWTSTKGADQAFLEEFRELAGGVIGNLKYYREATQKVAAKITRICGQRLVKVKTVGRRSAEQGVYADLDEFRKEQNDRLENELRKIARNYKEIVKILKELFGKLFRGNGVEVIVQWEKYVNLIDDCVERALRLITRKSLEILEEVLGSDDRERPLFCVNMLLQGRELAFEPSLEEMANMLMDVHVNLAKAVEPLGRLGKFLGAGNLGTAAKRDGYSAVILKDEDILEVRNKIAFTLERCLSEVNLYAERWIPYRNIWEVGREEFMRNYEKQYPDMAAYDKDLKRYTEISEIVHGADSIVTIRWLQVDCSKLKEGIAQESTEWFRLLAGTLYEKAKEKLMSVYTHMKENREKLSEEPGNLDEQLEMWKVAQDVRGKMKQKVVASFPDIQERFRLLRKYNYDVEPEIEGMEMGMNKEWRQYLKFLRETDDKLEKSQGRMKQAFLEQQARHKENANELQKLWEKDGPFTVVCGPKARNLLEHFRGKVRDMKKLEIELMNALEILNIKCENDKGLVEIEDEIDGLAQIWKDVNKWEMEWQVWKETKVDRVEVDTLDVKALEYLKVFHLLNKEFEIKSWPVITEIIEFIETVRKSLTCCQVLVQQTLQQRHWQWIKETVIKQCAISENRVPLSPQDWTLEMVVSFQLHEFLGPISELSWSSEKEMMIEQTLEKIQRFWENEAFFLRRRKRDGKRKDILFEIEISGEVLDTLMDHLVSLVAMKGSRFIGVFQSSVDYWEATLRTLNDSLPVILEAQHEWLALDKVFCSEHIQREMAGTARKFKLVTSVWASVLMVVTQVRNIFTVITQTENMVTMLTDLRSRMEEVKQELGVYLQGIRQEFPKFHFVSDDKLLGCLGGGKELDVYVHVMREIFGNLENVKLMAMENKDELWLEGIIARDREYLKLWNLVQVGNVPVETWFADFENSLKNGLKANLSDFLNLWTGHWGKLDELVGQVGEWTKQTVVTAVKIRWTEDTCTGILSQQERDDVIVEADEWSLKKLIKKLKKCIAKLASHSHMDGIREPLLVTLIYLRDVTERLYARACSDLESFEWLQYMRWHYWNGGAASGLVVKQGFACIPYGWEYYDGGKCIITPITERAFLALNTAMGFQMGAVIHGSSGKKETINELGRQLAKFVLNLRLTEHTEVEWLKGMIMGVAQCGAWLVFQGLESCQTETVNTLESKIALITKAKLGQYDKIVLDGVESKLHWGCQVFSLMSTAAWNFQMDRDHLASVKRVMRPVSLLQPDSRKILETKLFVGGFENFAQLAARIEGIFERARESLKELGRREDMLFSLNCKLVVVSQAVELKRSLEKKLNESEAIIKALDIVINPALKNKEESTIFRDLVKAHFPLEQETLKVKMENFHVEHFVRQSFTDLGYELSEKMAQSCMELYTLIQAFRAVVVLGGAATGKSIVRKILKNTISLLHESGNEENDCKNKEQRMIIEEYIVNPAAVDGVNELFGERISLDNGIKIWRDGILTKILKKDRSSKENLVWLVFDGPLNGHFIPEGIQDLYKRNSTITPGACITNPDIMFFETDNLASSSPGLLTGCGMLFLQDVNENEREALWKLCFQAWFTKLDSQFKAILKEFVRVVLEKCINFRMAHSSICQVYMGAVQVVKMFTGLLDTFLDVNKVQKYERQGAERLSLAAKQITAFCVTWSVFVGFNEEGQLKASAFLKDLPPLQQIFPAKRTIFEYFLDLESLKWLPWEVMAAETKLPQWNGQEIPFVSTVETVKVEYITKQYLSLEGNARPILICGPQDSGKSKLLTSLRQQTNSENGLTRLTLDLQLTPNMKARSTQNLLESRLEAASSVCLSPPAGKTLIVFVDDLNGSASSRFVGQPAISPSEEFLRYFTEHWMWYDSERKIPVAVSNVKVVASMTSVVRGECTEHSARLLGRFFKVYLPQPDDIQLRKIFTQKARDKLDNFNPPVKALVDSVTVATLEIYKLVKSEIQAPNPFHSFSLKDVSRVYEGLIRAHRDSQDTKLAFLRLWFHECSRVFADRLMDQASRLACHDILEKQLVKHFEISTSALYPSHHNDYSSAIFGDFLKGSKCYQEIKNVEKVNKLIQDKIRSMKKGSVVLFQESVLQVVKIARILSQRKGHLIICGLEGQGRKTLIRTAAGLYGYKILEMPSNSYKRLDSKPGSEYFKEILRDAYITCATENVGCCVIVQDTQVTEEILNLAIIATSTVEIPELFTKKDVLEICKNGCNGSSTLADKMNWMKERVEKNFHLVLCVKPTQEESFKAYPHLLKRMAVTWFDIWNQASFTEAAHYLLQGNQGTAEKHLASCGIFYTLHSASMDQCPNRGCVTPMHFVDLIEFYKWYRKTAKEEYARKMKLLKSAIQEIGDVRSKIGALTEQAEVAERKAETARQECERMLAVIQNQQQDANAQELIVREKEGQLEEEIKEFDELALVIKEEWSTALEDYEKEAEVLQDLAEDDLTHIRSYYSPPPLVSRVLDAVMIMLDRETSWPEAKIQLGHPGFIKSILEYDKARISMEKLNNLRKFIQNKEFTPEAISKYSNGARILCAWIHAIEKYGKCYLSKICPKREKLESSENCILEHRHILVLASEKLQLLRENLTELQTVYDTKWHFKESLEQDAKQASDVLGRATSVLRLLEQESGSEFRNHVQKWKDVLVEMDNKLESLEANALLSAAFLAYGGIFNVRDRKTLIDKWNQEIARECNVAITQVWKVEQALDFESELNIREKTQICLQAFYSTKEDEEEYEWLLENMILIKKSRRPVLCVDPLGVLTWIKSKESKLTEIEEEQVLLEQYDSIATGNRDDLYVSKELDVVNLDKTIYPRFSVVNFSLSQQGLKNYFTVKIAEMISLEEESRRQILLQTALTEQVQLDEFGEKIPRLVITCGGASILGNGDFSETLSKWQVEITNSETKLEEAKRQIMEIEGNRYRFLCTASHFTRLFHCILEMNKQCPFYEISLNYFTILMMDMFSQKFPPRPQLEDAESIRKEIEESMVDFLEDEVMVKLFEFLTKSMKQLHCFQFSLLLCIKTLLDECRRDEDRLHLQKEISLLTASRMENSKLERVYEKNDGREWLTDSQKESLDYLDNLKGFRGLQKSVLVSDSGAWNTWYTGTNANAFPEPWNSTLSPLQKFILVKNLRPECAYGQVLHLTEAVLGDVYARVLSAVRLVDVQEIYNDSYATKGPFYATPVIFLLDSNKAGLPDPQSSLQTLVKSIKPPQKLFTLSLSVRNSALTQTLVEEGSGKGFWVYLFNCHENRKWLYELQEMLITRTFHRNFFLWMCSRLCGKFPREIIRNSVKVMIEAPAAFHLNLTRLKKKSEDVFKSQDASEKLQQLLQGLCYLHCSLQEKSKKDLAEEGNVLQDIDFEVSSTIIKILAQKYFNGKQLPVPQFPWWALKYMLELQYANHFTHETSLQLVRDEFQRVFSVDLLSPEHFAHNVQSHLNSQEILGIEKTDGLCEDFVFQEIMLSATV